MKINEKKLAILKLLYQNEQKYISGEEISSRLGVSRTTVSNYIKELCNDDYNIEAKTRRGYRLLSSSHYLLPEEIKLRLETEFLGREIEYYYELPSTSSRAKELANSGVPEGMLVVAEKQSKGRGRRGRDWYSPAETGLWYSLILRPEFAPERAPFLTIISVLTIQEVLKKKFELNSVIKWPNDIYLKQKKLAGTLAEMSAEMDQINYAVVGTGINVNQKNFPDNLSTTAISLKQVLKHNVSRKELLADLIYTFENKYNQLKMGKENILIQWKEQLNILGKQVTIESENRIYHGQALDISEDGALLIQDESGKKHLFWAGEASLEKSEG